MDLEKIIRIKMTWYPSRILRMLFIFVFFDKSFDSFDEQHKNHFNPDNGTMTQHP